MKKTIRKIYLCFIITILFTTGIALGNDTNLENKEYTEIYKKWLELSDEQKENVIEPSKYNFYSKDTKEEIQLANQKMNLKSLVKMAKSSTYATSPKFSLKTLIDNNLEIKDQKSTNFCWAFASISSLETNLALKNYNDNKDDKIYDYSERHMVYSMTQSFKNGQVNTNGWKQKAKDGGTTTMSMAYLTNGSGAINEEDMKFVDSQEEIDINDIKNKQVPFKNVVYEYPLSEAIKDGYTRVPFAVTRTDIDFYHFGDEQLDKLMLNDGIKCHEMIKTKLASYSKVNNKPLVKPFMLVVCKDTNHAKIIEEYIKSDEFRNGKYKYKTIKIESKMSGVETEANTKLLLEVERVDNPIEIVIHVNMLKEGWDVNNLYTIVPLRTASSKILREQMVGRGLRLPYGERTGDKEIDSVMLTAHDKFQEILDEAQKGNSIFKLGNVIKVEEVEDEKFTYTQLALDLTEEQDELRGLLQVREDEEKYTFSNSINELVKDKVTEYVYNNENKMTEESRNTIKKQIEEEIKNNEDLGRIFEENRNPIESWMNKAIEKAEKESNNQFIFLMTLI